MDRFALSIPARLTCHHWRMFTGRRGRLSCGMRLKPGRGLILAAMVLFAVPGAQARDGESPPSAQLSLAQIVAGIQARSQNQNQSLRQYHALRTYAVEYHGLGALSARMQVEVTYDAAHGKSFRIVSQSGNMLLRDAVLKRAVSSEEEASKEKGATDLSPANYRFRLLGTDSINGRPTYILNVEPLKPGKFLYRGNVWVDAANFGVVKIQAAPAKNPSFWISKTTIWVTNELTDGFWLPEQTRSQTAVRMGGTATLTIDYGSYHIDQTAPQTALLPPDAGREEAGVKSR
ncbi:MAG TPA: hypothetical protein VGR47_23285 [Terracidiphilus sp.]|nr:hypothetical protein [Terracidiphilus sp.]